MGLIKKEIVKKLISNVSCRKFIEIKENDFQLKENKPRIFIAAMPKSAGTFLSKNISKIINTNYLHVGDVQGRCEFDIYVPNFLDEFLMKGGVVHQHINATKGNVEYLNKFNIKPVVVIRDLKEVLYSMHRHIVKYRNVWPNFIYPVNFFSWNYSNQLDFIIDYVMPGIIEFKVSWENAIDAAQVQVLRTNYKSIVSDPENVIKKILDWNNLLVPKNIKIEILDDMRVESNSLPLLSLNKFQEERFLNLLSYYSLNQND